MILLSKISTLIQIEKRNRRAEPGNR